ncbi:conjugal transfer protein [Mycobacterium sp. SMC-2]|uniref:conjugal transfer protein n=1 Tax=Mycobacterium TaxID=1763 RepID=UPI001CE03C9F|nr:MULTISPECIES: conjugal transfer protein [Mycobacterium]MCA4761170.1 conjugal transfer protein [Mycobacterium avium subsp. hominissuis]UXA06496.1 conjugal transfer protein [Mycobacterium sp. SMC-2]
MKISNVWRHRLTVMGHRARQIAIVVLVASSAINGIALLWRAFFPPDPPPVAAVAREVINQIDPVKAFAENCVKGILGGTASGAENLTRCFPDGRKYELPTTSSMTVSNPTAWASKRQPSSNDVAVYSVIVQVDEQPYPSAPPATAFYQLPVAVYREKGIQALDRISRVDGPPPGAYVPLGYSVTIPTNSPLFSMLSGFAAAFLTTSGGLERFITTDSGITAVGCYASATLRTAQTDTNPPDAAADNAELAAHIDVSARRPDYTLMSLSYSLTLRSVGGTWFVAQIDAIPVLANTTPTPVPTTSAAAH